MSALVLVGYIDGAFGVQGEARVKAFTAELENIVAYGPLMDEHGKVVLTPKKWRRIGDALAVSAPEIATREIAMAMKGVSLYAPRSAFPDAEEEEFYVVDLIGCRTDDAAGNEIGIVTAVHNFGAGDILEIRTPSGATIHVAFTQANVPQIDVVARRLVVVPPPEMPDDAPEQGETA